MEKARRMFSAESVMPDRVLYNSITRQAIKQPD
jgi:hypothetical protein